MKGRGLVVFLALILATLATAGVFMYSRGVKEDVQTGGTMIPVVVTVRPPVVLQPNDLILQPKVDEAGTATGQVLAAVREDLDPKTLAVTTDDKSFVARIEVPGERAFRLTVDWKPEGKKSPTETKIHLAVGGETIDLPVRVNLSRAGVPEPAKTH